jgi:hypothetical protein
VSAQAGAGRRRRSGWRRPRVKDPAFWTAVAISVVVFGLQLLLVGERNGLTAWLVLAVRAAVTWVIVSALIRIRVGLRRGLVDGYRAAEVQARSRPGGRSTSESVGRTAGRTMGRALAAYKRSKE